MAIAVKIGCTKCEEVFEFSPKHHSLLGLKDIPKICPKCADIRQGKKVVKIVVKRELLNEWKGVYVENIDFLKGEDDNDRYICKYYGGRNFGIWGGVRFSQRYLIFINKQIVEFPAIVDIRQMRKIWQGVDGRDGESVYFVIDPSEVEKQWYLYELRSWHKTTLKGYGRDRNYKEYFEPVDSEEAEVNSEVLCEVESWGNSGRFGNKYMLLLTDKPCKVIGDGIE
jgi:hypothetical protein